MKSISIIYKRPKKIKQESEQQQKNQFRRYVDEYFTKITNRNQEKAINEEKLRSKTARITSKFNHINKAFDSLNIMTLKTPALEPNTKKIQSEKILKKTIQFNVQRLKKNQSDFALRLQQQHQQIQERRLSPRKEFMRPKDWIKHGKANPIGKIKCPKDITLVISADFIINEFSFWGEEYIEMNCLKGWKTLSPLANIVWVVRRFSTAMKIQEFAQNWNLKIDGILQIEPNKKQSFTVSFSTFEQEAKLKKDSKLVFINSLRTQTNNQEQSQSIRYFQFKNSLPIVNHKICLVHFIKTDVLSDRNRFNSVLKVVSSRYLPPKFDLEPLMLEYREKKNRQIVAPESLKFSNQKISQIALKSLQKLKAKLYAEFEQNIGLNTKIEGDSMFYLIGDLIRRNYSIAKQLHRYQNQVQNFRNRKMSRNGSLQSDSDFFNQSKTAQFLKSSGRPEYQQSVHIWEF